MIKEFSWGILIVLLLTPDAESQSAQRNSFQVQNVWPIATDDRKSNQEIGRDVMLTPARNGQSADSKNQMNYFRSHEISHSVTCDKILPPRPHRNLNRFGRILLPKTQISVIDTAIVLNKFNNDTTKHVYSFNGMVKMTSDVTQRLNGIFWLNVSRFTFSYDANGKMLSRTYETWSNGQWVGVSRYNYSYDSNGNILSNLFEVWSNGQWINNYRYTYVYDEKGDMLTGLGEYASQSQWVNYEHYTYTYDSTGNRISELYETWSNDQWINSERYTFTYDANGNMLSDTYEIWYLYGQWGKIDRYSYIYDSSGKELSELHEVWSTGQWQNSQHFTHTYDQYGYKVSVLREQWNTRQWENLDRHTYTNDASGNLLSDLFEEWLNGQWSNYDRKTYAYDTNGELVSIWYYPLSGYSWATTDASLNVVDKAGNSYAYAGYNVNFVRKTVVTGLATQPSIAPASYSLWQNYPNPFNPVTHIQYFLPVHSRVRITIHNMLGQVVDRLADADQEPGEKDISWNGFNLSSGVYFCRLEAVGTSNSAQRFIQTRKMVLIK